MDATRGDVRSSDVQRPDDACARHRTNAFTTLQDSRFGGGCGTRRPRRDDDRLGVGERMHVAGGRNDVDQLAGDEVERMKAAERVVRDVVSEVEPVHGEEELGQRA